MENLILISEVAQELGQHGNAARIKKLIFATWKNRWENDLTSIDRFPLTNILQELVNNSPTPEQLRSTFFNIVNTLNKKEEYAVVAEAILSSMERLYPEQEPKTEMVYAATMTPRQSLPIYPNPAPAASPFDSSIDTITHVRGKIESIPELDSSHHSKSPHFNYDPFAIRLAVMKYGNPLRAKMLLLSVLEEQTSLNQGIWLKLRSRNLDELLMEVFQKFSSLEQMESQLFATASRLQQSGDNAQADDNAQAAEAIVKAMKPFYQEAVSA